MERRVRTGCITCRKRRVKCDETRPFCNRCRNANFVCEGYKPPRRASPDEITQPVSNSRHPPHEESPPAELTWRHANWRQEQLPIYHHFVTATVARLFRHDHVGFWRDEVAQMSYGLDIVYEALLAIGAVHYSALLVCQNSSLEEASRSRIIGYRAYGNALRLLPSHLLLRTRTEISAVLIVLMLLAYFECFQENQKGAFQHLWAAIQLARASRGILDSRDDSTMVPILDAMLHLDFLALKLVPYSGSSLCIYANLALNERPFWNRPSPTYIGNNQLDIIASERHRLMRLISGHNQLSHVVWGCWYPTGKRPSRHELLGFYYEMQLWKANSPATFARCDGLDEIEAFDNVDMDLRPMPPPACQLLSTEMALNIAVYNAYIGCCIAMITTTDEDPAEREKEAFNITYQSLCIAAGLIENHTNRHNNQTENPYKPCESISMGISIYLHHGVRRCFSRAWQDWSIAALRSIGREGLSNGYTWANASEIMCQLEARMPYVHATALSPLGHIRDRFIPLLMPRQDDGSYLSFFLRYGDEMDIGDERHVKIVAKATWAQDAAGTMKSSIIDLYDSAITGNPHLAAAPLCFDMFDPWRQEVEKGWHRYLTNEPREESLET